MVLWDDKHCNYWCHCLLLLFLSFYYWAQHRMVLEHPFGQLGSALSSPKILPVLSILADGGRVEKRGRTSVLCQHYAVTAKTSVCCQQLKKIKRKGKKHRTAVKKIKSIPAKPSTTWEYQFPTFQQLEVWQKNIFYIYVYTGATMI